jgi:hypothetical protein
MPTRIVTVFGATGTQGIIAVVTILHERFTLSYRFFRCQSITRRRDIHSEGSDAQSRLREGVETQAARR